MGLVKLHPSGMSSLGMQISLFFVPLGCAVNTGLEIHLRVEAELASGPRGIEGTILSKEVYASAI
jgi:hypothetical protein